jgi:hypothetical protein
MTLIRAHFDGNVFVPDEAVAMKPGTAVVVTAGDDSHRPASTDFLRPVLFPPDPEASRRFLEVSE